MQVKKVPTKFKLFGTKHNNSSYKGKFGSNWQLTTGLSYGYGGTDTSLNSEQIENNEHASHLKIKLKN